MEQKKIVYLCDEKACKDCRSKASECHHTSDIRHAINFEETVDGKIFFESEYKTTAQRDRQIVITIALIAIAFIAGLCVNLFWR